jgi:hypothetical protein
VVRRLARISRFVASDIRAEQSVWAGRARDVSRGARIRRFITRYTCAEQAVWARGR